MIRTRLLVGSLLALAAAGLLLADRHLAPWFPVLFLSLVLVGVLATREIVALFPQPYRPSAHLAVAAVVAILAANWYSVVRATSSMSGLPRVASPWEPVLFMYFGVVIVAFAFEMALYRRPGIAVPRLGLLVLAVSYLGLSGSFLAQLRWLDPDPVRSSAILALAIFVPKFCDIGAFFTGTFLGRHQMMPILSPKKTWEGFAGGLLAAVGAAVGLMALVGYLERPLFPGGLTEALGFGLLVGGAGTIGDLAESLIKRDCRTKDAAVSIPGFGGLLDVVDSILFAGPVVYFWFRA